MWPGSGEEWTGLLMCEPWRLTVLVSEGGRHLWVSMCTVWPLHLKLLSEQSNELVSNFVLSLNIPLQKLFGWFRRLSEMIQWVQHKWKCGTNTFQRWLGICWKCQTPENVEHVRAAINKDQQLTVWELDDDLGIPNTIVSKILEQDLGMKCVVAKFVPRLLLPEQKEHCATIASDFIQTTTDEPHFLKVMTGDESWSGHKGPVVPMEVTWFSMYGEVTAKLQQDEDHVNCVLWLGRCCPSQVPLQAQ